jgi:hypothetical protein
MKKLKLRFIHIVLATLVLSCLNYLLTVPMVNFITGIVVFILSDALSFLYLKITASVKRE